MDYMNLPFKLQPPKLRQVSITEPETFELNENEKSKDGFFFEFRVKTRFLWEIRPLIGETSIVQRRRQPMLTARFLEDPSLFNSRYSLYQIVSEMLSFLDINMEMQRNLLNPIVTVARKMVNRGDNLGKKTLLMRVELTRYCVHLHDEAEVIRQALLESEESEEEWRNQMRGASKSAIDSLEIVEFNDGNDQFTTSCVVCLDEFGNGYEITRLHCSHVFHGNCIKQWLEKSHFCPICRFEMPIDEAQ